MANFIQFCFPAAPDHCKQTILRIGEMLSLGACILNKIHSSKQGQNKKITAFCEKNKPEVFSQKKE